MPRQRGIWVRKTGDVSFTKLHGQQICRSIEEAEAKEKFAATGRSRRWRSGLVSTFPAPNIPKPCRKGSGRRVADTPQVDGT
jgi:hypothetical protein